MKEGLVGIRKERTHNRVFVDGVLGQKLQTNRRLVHMFSAGYGWEQLNSGEEHGAGCNDGKWWNHGDTADREKSVWDDVRIGLNLLPVGLMLLLLGGVAGPWVLPFWAQAGALGFSAGCLPC